MGRLPAAAGRGTQRGHPRPPALPRRRFQGPRRCETQPRDEVPGRHRRRGEQAVRPAAGRPRHGRAAAVPNAARTDTPLPVDGRSRVGEPDTVGHPDQRPRVAPLRLPRPAARIRVFRGRPRRGAAARQRGRPAPLLPAAAPELLHAPGRRHVQLPGDGAVGGAAPRAAGRRGHLGRGVRARLPHPRPGPGSRHGRGASGGPRGRAHLPLPAALRALRRGPGAAPRERPPVRGLRPAEAGARGHRAQDGRRRRLLEQRLELLRPPGDALQVDRRGRRVHRAPTLQRRPLRRRCRAAAAARPPAGLGRRPHRLRPEPRPDRRRAALHQLPRHVGAAARIDLRAPAGARARQGRSGQDRRAAQQLRPQGQRQLLHAPGARRPDRRPDAEAARRGASDGLREEGRGAEARPDGRRPSARPSCARWTRPWPCST